MTASSLGASAMNGPVMVYGATGFSGRALAARLCQADHDVVLAGRNAGGVQALSQSLGAPFRAFDLRDPGAVDLGLKGINVVLNAAGPFMDTAAPMIDACIRMGAHYLDLAGEWPIFAMAQGRGAEARKAGVMLMPGVGFAVAVSDCLIAHAVRQAPGTSLLRIAIGLPGVVSRGTLRSAVGVLGSRVVVRRAGVLRSVPAGATRRSFNFGAGEHMSVAVSWPDVVTAHTTTGVPNIEAFMEAPFAAQVADRAAGLAGDILSDEALRAALAPFAAVWPDHPSVEAQSRASNAIVVEAVDSWRRVTRFGLKTLDGYSVTNATAPAIVARVLAGEHPPGFQTPGGAYGPELIAGLGCAEAYDATRVAPRSNSVTVPQAGMA
jgi:saccharopine dehydrogenase (NAD+, L-lysine-forming)